MKPKSVTLEERFTNPHEIPELLTRAFRSTRSRDERRATFADAPLAANPFRYLS